MINREIGIHVEYDPIESFQIPGIEGLKHSELNDYLWIFSELLYYIGLILSVFAVPGLTLSLWSLSLADVIEPDYSYLTIAWIVSLLMFFGGVMLKNKLYK